MEPACPGATRLSDDPPCQRALEGLRHAIDQHAILSIADAAGNIVDVNDLFCAISGYRREELLGRNHRVVRSGLHPPAFYAEMWSTILAGQVWHGEVCNRRKNGELYWVSSTIVPYLDEAGRPWRYISLRTDITALKRAQESQRIQARAMEASINGIAIADAGQPDYPLIYVNPAFERTTGYRAPEVLGHNCRFLQGGDTDQPGLEEIRRALRSGGAGRALLRNYRADGSLFWNDFSIAPVHDETGRATHFIGVINDVTSRQEAELALRDSEARFRGAFRDAPTGMALVSMRDGAFIQANTALCELLGYSEDELLARRFADVTHPDDLELGLDLFRQLARGERRTMQIEKRYLHKDGSPVWALLTTSVVTDAGDVPRYCVSHVLDIRTRKAYEAALMQARDAAEQASQAKSEFLSSMTHELRTPLNSILGFAQLMEMDPALARDTRENAGEILRAGRHLLDLINEVLDLARIEAGRVNLNLEAVDCPAVAQECLALLRPQAESAGITLEADEPEPVRVWADWVRLKQIVLNMLTNAIKYNRAGGRVHLAVSSGPEPGTVRWSVMDTGLGIPVERQDGVFKPFNRLGAETGSVEGTGIGLAISLRMAETMGGRMGFTSVPGEGSHFWLDLPKAAEPGQVDGGGCPCASWREFTVLLVHDDPEAQRELIRLLGRCAGVSLLTAHTLELGLTLIQARRPDLVLLDARLHGAERLPASLAREHGAAAPPVVALAAADMSPGELDVQAGYHAWLMRPLSVERLRAMILALPRPGERPA